MAYLKKLHIEQKNHGSHYLDSIIDGLDYLDIAFHKKTRKTMVRTTQTPSSMAWITWILSFTRKDEKPRSALPRLQRSGTTKHRISKENMRNHGTHHPPSQTIWNTWTSNITRTHEKNPHSNITTFQLGQIKGSGPLI